MPEEGCFSQSDQKYTESLQRCVLKHGRLYLADEFQFMGISGAEVKKGFCERGCALALFYKLLKNN